MQEKWKKLLLYVLTGGMCGISVAGNYPLLPLVFTAVFLEQVKKRYLFLAAYIGIVAFMPPVTGMRYAMALLTTGGIIYMGEKLRGEKCTDLWAGVLAAGIEVFLRIAGGMLTADSFLETVISLLEGTFIFGGILLLHPYVHSFLEKKDREEGWMEEQKLIPARNELLEYADSFQKLSGIYAGMEKHAQTYPEETDKDFPKILAGQVCVACPNAEYCLETRGIRLLELLHKAFFKVLEEPEAEELEICKSRCIQEKKLFEKAGEIFEQTRMNQNWYNRLLENREIVSQQFNAMAYILQSCGEGEKILPKELSREIEELFRDIGVRVGKVEVIRTVNRKIEIRGMFASRFGRFTRIRQLEQELNEENILDRRWEIENVSRDEWLGAGLTELIFKERVPFFTIRGEARRKKEGAKVSGDNFSFLDLKEGRFVMALSDGMGSGPAACKESEMVLELMEKFLEAGFPMGLSIDMLNASMVIHGNGNTFSTLDISEMDLYEGSLTTYKIGGSTSFIKRGTKVELVSGPTLPTGVDIQTKPEIERYRLQSGDMVILISDGILDGLHVVEPEWEIKAIIEQITTTNPGKMAEEIMDTVEKMCDYKDIDDKTVLVTGIWER